MTTADSTHYRYTSVGGSNTHVVLEFPSIKKYLYMGSLVTISYQVHRDKTPVFNCGSPLIDGFAIGNKYVAGSMVTTMYSQDELSNFIDEYGKYYNGRDGILSRSAAVDARSYDGESHKPIHTMMSDDLTSFNIHIIFANEYNGETRQINIYGANFLNNGRVMSIDDLVTETTYQYVARDIKEQHDHGSSIEGLRYFNSASTGTKLLKSLGKL